jgi:hypothetical protein
VRRRRGSSERCAGRRDRRWRRGRMTVGGENVGRGVGRGGAGAWTWGGGGTGWRRCGWRRHVGFREGCRWERVRGVVWAREGGAEGGDFHSFRSRDREKVRS